MLKSRSAKTLEVSWTKPEEGGNAQPIREYVVWWTSGAANIIENKTATNVSTVIDSLSPNTVYEIAVAARGTIEQSHGKISDSLQELTCEYKCIQFFRLCEVQISKLTKVSKKI